MSAREGALRDAFARLAPGRRPHGIAAALLPYTADGDIAWADFERHVARTHEAGLGVAVNMDTGFGDLLTPPEREQVLAAVRRALGAGVSFYAGAFGEGAEPLAAYERSLAAIAAVGATPVIVQCRAMQQQDARDKAELYRRIAERAEGGALAFELSPRFAPHGEIWDEDGFARILEIDAIRGAKHSSLDRGLELRRLAACDRRRPDFRVYTGNDLAIDMVAYGSDYLLGLATFAPDAFAARDRALERGELDFLPRNDDLQHLGNVGFREPIPAYKHAAALFLELTGGLTTAHVHPKAPRRPAADLVPLFDCARRLGLLADPERIWQERVAPRL